MSDRSYVRRRGLPAFAALREITPAPLTAFASRPSVFFVIQIATLLLAYLLVNAFVRGASGLGMADYSQPVIAVQVLDNIGLLRLLLIAIVAVALFRFGGLWSAWYQFENSNALRAFVIFLCALMAWPLVTAGYNYFFGQGYVEDRIILLVLLLLTWWRPVFILPFVILCFAMLGQLTAPALGGTVTAHKIQVLNVISLFFAAFFLHSVTGDRRTGPFIFLTCAMVAAAYWLPAVAKFKLDWLAHDQLFRMPLAAYAHGWLGHWSPQEIVAFAQKLQPLDLPLRVLTLALEAAFLVFLLRRGLSLALLIGAIVFHVGVFALYGFLFWPWMALDLALFWFLLRHVDRQDNDIYGILPFLVSLPLIGFGDLWAKPPKLGWYDTPLTYTYRIDVLTADGERERLHPRAFAPYEDVFTMASFGYLSGDHPVLVGAYGVTMDGSVREGLDAARSAQDVFALEQETDRVTYRESRTRRFEHFLRTYIDNYNKASEHDWPWYWFHPPLQFWSQAPGATSLGSQRVVAGSVTEVTTFYDGTQLLQIREQEVARVSIAQPTGAQ